MATLMEQGETRHAQMRAELQVAVTDGVKAAVTDHAVIRSVMNLVALAAQERATQAAGKGVWWLIRSAFSKWLVIAFIVVMAAKFVGWDVAAKIGKFLSGGT